MLGTPAPYGTLSAQMQAALYYARRNRVAKVRAEQSDGPTLTVAPAVTGTPRVGQVLTAGNGSWTGSGALAYYRMWLLNGAPTGITTTTYTPVLADIGKVIAVRVVAKDNNGNTSAYSNSSTILAAA